MQQVHAPSLVLTAVVLLTPLSCLGENSAPVDFDAFVDSLPDKGRRAVDRITQPGVLSITFDDGPSDFSRDIIDTLSLHHVQATFFWVGRNIPGKRDVLDYARAHDQQVGSHSYNHEPQPTLSEAVFKQRIEAVKINIGDADRGRLLFRFPYGAAGDDQLRWLSELKFDGKTYRPVGWHSDSQDFDFDSVYPADQFSVNILDDSQECGGQANPFQHDMVGWTQFIARKTKGGVILFHDTHRITRDKLDAVLRGYESPSAYLAALPDDKRAEYLRYYDCEKVDSLLHLRLEPLWGGTWPSYRD